ncbi:hypothetical protein [Actinomycetospora cinnamomea]|uniref:Uncharacterized protein n=1 Tax=Actinomycetospora cinnamomea TaxID=663609 RepID=A0A2U1F3W0_9PSEU|nr:hypothetical protein [Actinomycetospora cinnamomea]PVZ06857.1 hypothetical protein C8D89_11250 [Actinomycetospora cinnamomea]
MPTRGQVSRALAGGTDYAAAGRALGIPAGQVYMIMTGVPADGSGTTRAGEAPEGVLKTAQQLVHPPAQNPTTKPAVHRWVARRAAELEAGSS